MRKLPLAIDLYCGLGGWAEGLLAEGFRVVGFDIERHDYGTGGYPGQLVIQDVTTLHGSQFRNATVIVASPPCQAYSYRAMPWKRAKALPPPSNELFDACFRIQREAIAATRQRCPVGHLGKGWELDNCHTCHGSGYFRERYIPLIVENVRGAVKWVSQPVRWHFGSYYLWGDVPALMPTTLAQKFNPDGTAHGSGSWFAIADSVNRGAKTPTGNNSAPLWKDREIQRLSHQRPDELHKTVCHVNQRDGHSHTRHLTNQREHDGVKQSGISGTRNNGKGDRWFQDGAAKHGSKSNSRKAASALIAKIPFPLAQHIARTYYPREG